MTVLTGDHEATAAFIAQSVGIDRIHADLLPADKTKVIASLQAEGVVVAVRAIGRHRSAGTCPGVDRRTRPGLTRKTPTGGIVLD